MSPNQTSPARAPVHSHAEGFFFTTSLTTERAYSAAVVVAIWNHYECFIRSMERKPLTGFPIDVVLEIRL